MCRIIGCVSQSQLYVEMNELNESEETDNTSLWTVECGDTCCLLTAGCNNGIR